MGDGTGPGGRALRVGVARGQEIRVLVVAADEAFAERTADHLERRAGKIAVTVVSDPVAVPSMVRDTEVDCVVAEFEMPEMDGLELLDAVRAVDSALPFMLFTGEESGDVTSEAVKRGVTDCFVKETGTAQLELLVKRIEDATAATRAERRFHDQETRFRKLTEGTSDMFAVLDSEGTYTFASLSIEEILGHDPAALAGEPVIEYVHPDDQGAVDGLLHELIDDPTSPATAEFRYRDAAGDWRLLEATARNRLEDPDVEGVVMTTRDVTERAAREQELQRYETIINTVGAGIYALDAEGRYTLVNDRTLERTGYSREELLGEHVSEVLSDEALEAGVNLIEDLWTNPDKTIGTYEATIDAVGGGSFPVENRISVLPSKDGEFIGTVGVSREITKRVEREEELQRQNDRLRTYETLVETVPAGVIETDAEGTMVTVNAEWARMVGRDQSALEGETFASLVDEGIIESQAAATYQDLLRELLSDSNDRDRGTVQTSVVPPGETTEHTYDVHVALLPYEEAFQGSVVVVVDVTERVKNRRKLERQNERLDEFASVITHDLRNPLNLAMGNLELARERGDESNFEVAAQALDRIDRLIDDILTLAREGATVDTTGTVSLPEIVDACCSALDSPDISVEAGVDRPFRADASRLQQLLDNLIRNAIEHGGEGVKITVGPVDGGFYIADDGPGITPADREVIFEAGYSRTQTGTGFGLRIVQQIVEAHGWEISVTDSASGGARFEITGVTFVQ